MKMNDSGYPTLQLDSLFLYQKEFQMRLGYEEVSDNVEMLKQNVLGLIGEIGEVLQADQRWKDNGRNKYYNLNEKKKEIADCLIYLINICLFSDISSQELYEITVRKIDENFKRLKK